jgi:hypothetical protein
MSVPDDVSQFGGPEAATPVPYQRVTDRRGPGNQTDEPPLPDL